MENNSLTQFGTGFQSKIITSCLLDTMFLVVKISSLNSRTLDIESLKETEIYNLS